MNTVGTLGALVQEKLDADAEFQSSLAALSDEEKAQAISAKRDELMETEFRSARETASKNDEVAKNQKTRAEKAEEELKKFKPAATDDKKDDFTPQDYALLYAKVHEDDVQEVIKAAKLLGKSLTDALKDDTVQAILKTRVEKRKTADATNTGTNRRSVKTPTDEEVLSEASKGNIPEKGSKEAEQLFIARRKRS